MNTRVDTVGVATGRPARAVRGVRRGVALPVLVAVAVALAGAAAIAGWRAQARWRPHTLTKDGAEAGRLLEQSGWVSPGLKGPALYMVSFRSCPDCIRFEREQFPVFQKAGVDTRVIMVARRAKSTPAERSGVAELWANRSWDTYERWTGMPVAAWTAAGLPVADNTPERAALVERGRALVDRLDPILRENGVSERLHYPTLVWRDAKGDWRSCNCEDPRTYAYVRRELGVAG